jgi:carbohydrate-selective porin OprB
VEPFLREHSAHETTYELTYRFEVGHGVAIQPDIQYVQDPYFLTKIKDTLVGTFRFEIAL